jgi:hypothetical protein
VLKSGKREQKSLPKAAKKAKTSLKTLKNNTKRNER